MGHDISSIGNHKLDTSNIENLAKDLASRIDINIEYGYFGYKEHFKLLGEDKEDAVIILGSIFKDEKFKTYKLIDEGYHLKQLYKKYGMKLFDDINYWSYYSDEIPSKDIVDFEKKELLHFEYELSYNSKMEYESLTINTEHFGNDIPYYSRWWSFCEFFTDKAYEDADYLKPLNDFRRELLFYSKRFGGDKIYYLDDQSSNLGGVGQGDESELSWNELENFVTEKTEDLLLDIPKFFTDKSYQNDFLSKKKMPLAFVDDFRDLK